MLFPSDTNFGVLHLFYSSVVSFSKLPFSWLRGASIFSDVIYFGKDILGNVKME
jgi:hypothetical protein